MDNTHAADARRPEDERRASDPLTESDPLFSDDRLSSKARVNGSPGVLARLAGRWWPLLLVWLTVTATTAVLIFFLVRPTYTAASLLGIQPPAYDTFGPLPARSGNDSRDVPLLKAQVSLITSAKVFNDVLADPKVVGLTTVAASVDAEKLLREELKAEIVEDTNLIRVSLELPSRDDAVAIVKAVVQSYLAESADSRVSANRETSETRYRAVLIDPASASRMPSHNKRLKFMVGTPIFAFLLVFALFLGQEIMAGQRDARARNTPRPQGS
jgi:capsular polysaccharide biosynthesis protein